MFDSDRQLFRIVGVGDVVFGLSGPLLSSNFYHLPDIHSGVKSNTVRLLCIQLTPRLIISMPDETLLLYTRRHLAQSHLLAPQPSTHCRLPPLAPIVDIRDPFAFSPCDGLDVSLAQFIHTEKLILEHDTAIYLSSILSAPDDEETLLCGDLRWSRAHRIEEPPMKETRKRKTHRVKEDILKEVPLGIGGDAGVMWDRNVRHQVQEYVRNSEAEKMSIGPEVLRFLQDVHNPGTPSPTMGVAMEEVKYCRVQDLLKLMVFHIQANIYIYHYS